MFYGFLAPKKRRFPYIFPQQMYVPLFACRKGDWFWPRGTVCSRRFSFAIRLVLRGDLAVMKRSDDFCMRRRCRFPCNYHSYL